MRKTFFIVLSIVIANCNSNQKKETSANNTSAFLRVEAEGHVSKVNKIATNKDESVLVSVSDDKTIRVWDIKNGNKPSLKLNKTIRPPIQEGDKDDDPGLYELKMREGTLYAVALTPDSETIAAGGWTGYNPAKNTNSIYFFDLFTGKMNYLRDIVGGSILHLSFSNDGKYLIATLQKGGIRLFKQKESGFEEIDKDENYVMESYWADFSPTTNNLFATTSFDNRIRLYRITNDKLEIISNQKLNSEKPFSLKFSPEGKEIAVGYLDFPKIDVYEINNSELKYSFSPDTTIQNKEKRGEDFSRVNYSGSELYAGGSWEKSIFNYPIRKWQNKGKGNYADFVVSSNTITQLLPLKKGGVLYATAEPSIGIVDSNGIIAYQEKRRGPDHRRFENFKVSEDGTSVAFSFELKEKSEIYEFRLGKQENFLTEYQSESNSQKLLPPNSIFNIINKQKFEVNEAEITLNPGEQAKSGAFSSDNKNFLIGTSWYLRYYSATGLLRWRVPVSEEVYAVNLSKDGRFALAGLGDGTIRWYNTLSGEELLILFPHRDRKRWVVWTPRGFYDASIGGEDIVGLHVNAGKNKKSFFYPIARYRKDYYRADIIAKVLQTGNIHEAVALSEKETGVRTKGDMTSNESNSSHISVSIVEPREHLITIKDNKPLKIKYEFNDISSLRPAKVYAKIETTILKSKDISDDKDNSIELDLESLKRCSDNCKIFLSFNSENGEPIARTNDINVVIKESQKNEIKQKPTLYIVSIGINSGKLKFADNDAKDFIDTFKSQKGSIYKNVISIGPIVNENANKEDILSSIKKFFEGNSPESNDITMIFYSGHGVAEFNGFYFITSKKEGTGIEKFHNMEFLSAFNGILGRVILFVDACYSEKISSERNTTPLVNVAKDRFAVFASSKSSEKSFENDELKNGAFTSALKKAMNSKESIDKDKKNGTITLSSLYEVVKKEVDSTTKSEQHPVLEIKDDFEIAFAPK